MTSEWDPLTESFDVERPDPDNAEPDEWHCICGSGDDAEWHSILCVGSNTPDVVWWSEDVAT